MTCHVNLLRIVRILLYITFSFLCVSITRSLLVYVFGHPTLFGFARLLDVDGESNLPTWFSSSLLLISAFIIIAIASMIDSRVARYAAHWKVLAGIFIFLSIDEICCIHESVGNKIHAAFSTTGYLSYPWILPWCIFILIAGLFYVRFLVSLPSHVRNQIITAAFIYVGGAVGVELIEAGYQTVLNGQRDLIYTLMTVVEESMEMLGVVIFIGALSRYIYFLNDKRSVVDTEIVNAVKEPFAEDLAIR